MESIKKIVISAEDFIAQIPHGKHVRIIPEEGFDGAIEKHPIAALLYSAKVGSYCLLDSSLGIIKGEYTVDLRRISIKGYTWSP